MFTDPKKRTFVYSSTRYGTPDGARNFALAWTINIAPLDGCNAMARIACPAACLRFTILTSTEIQTNAER